MIKKNNGQNSQRTDIKFELKDLCYTTQVFRKSDHGGPWVRVSHDATKGRRCRFLTLLNPLYERLAHFSTFIML